MQLPRLGVNIDHVATLRQLRGTAYPDLLEAARLVEAAGADQITVHLREDRRHIQDADVKRLRAALKIPLNLEMGATSEMVKIATRISPQWVCLVPEKRQELTTEGGLDLIRGARRLGAAIQQLKRTGIFISLFIEPSLRAVKLSRELGADAVEFHTGRYCLATQLLDLPKGGSARAQARADQELERLQKSALAARQLGIRPHAGHGFDYKNVRQVVALEDLAGQPLIEEYNIGHSIICRAVLVGLTQAVREMIFSIHAP